MTYDPTVDFDHTAEAFFTDSFAIYQRLHRECPVARGTRFGGFWALSRYEDVYRTAHDTKRFTSSQGVTIPAFGNPVPVIPLEADPPLHAEYRRLVLPSFSPESVARYEDRIRETIRELLTPALAKGKCDVAVELAQPLPAITIAMVLGLPEDSWPVFRAISDRMLQTGRQEDIDANAEAAIELCRFLWGQAMAKRDDPGDDVVSQIVNGSVDGRPLTEEEQLGLLILLAIAGHETTAAAITNLLYQFGVDDDSRGRLLADPSLVGSAVEEILRFESPVQGLARTVAEDTTFGNVQVKEGDRILLVWCAANHDAAVFPQPDEFVIDRHPNHHLAFGIGPHRCIGSSLARLEMRLALEEVLALIPDYRVIEPQGIKRTGGLNRYIESLWVDFQPQPRPRRRVPA